MQASIVRIIVDERGESRFADDVDTLAPAMFAPPAPPLHVSEPHRATSARFIAAPAGWDAPPHPAPAVQWVTFLRGRVEVRTTDGAVRQFGPGSVIRLEDTVGSGHAAMVLPGDDWVALVVVE